MQLGVVADLGVQEKEKKPSPWTTHPHVSSLIPCRLDYLAQAVRGTFTLVKA